MMERVTLLRSNNIAGAAAGWKSLVTGMTHVVLGRRSGSAFVRLLAHVTKIDRCL